MDASGAQPGLSRFMDRLTAILGLVGLTALLLGGIGIAQAVSGYLDGRAETIATMKCLGAPARVVTLDLSDGDPGPGPGRHRAGTGGRGPAPGRPGPGARNGDAGAAEPGPPMPRPWAQAGAYGLLTVLAFSLPALGPGLADGAPGLVSGRGRSGRGPGLLARPGCRRPVRPGPGRSGRRHHPGSPAGPGIRGGGAGLGRGVFQLFGLAAGRLARLAPRRRPGLAFLALRALARPGNRQAGRILAALGLGLSTLCAMGQVDANFAQALVRDIPREAPDFFFMDIQPGQLAGFEAAARGVAGVTRLDVSPMSRGRLTRLGDRPAESAPVSEDAVWAVRGDRGLTFADAMPRGTRLVAGAWWPPGYRGEPLVSVDEGVAKGLGIGLGDTVTINALGRDITARVASLRRVNWLGLSINFVFVFSPGALDGLPFTYLATAHADRAGPGDPVETLYRTIADGFPGITVIGVGEALNDVRALADKVETAVTVAAGTTLLAGVLVLIQTMAAGMRAKAYETVVYKACGASRRDILAVLSLENGLLGLLAGLMALVLGVGLAWAFVNRFMELPFQAFPGRAVITVLAATGLTLGLGLTGIVRLLARKAWPSLRNE